MNSLISHSFQSSPASHLQQINLYMYRTNSVQKSTKIGKSIRGFWYTALLGHCKKKMLMVFITIEMCLLVGNIPFGEAVAAAKTWCFSCVFRLPIQQPHNSDFDSDGFCTLATCNGEVHRYPAQSPRKREGVESSASGSTNWHYGTMDATDRAVAIPAGIDRHPPYWRAPCRSSKR